MEIIKNKVYRVEIEDLNNLGYGVARIFGKVVFVKGGVDGDIAEIKIIKVNKSYAVAIIERLLAPSLYRREPDCKVSEKCGGCAFCGITYEHEKELKHRYVRSCFNKCGLRDVEIAGGLSTGKTERYRNKAQFALSGGESGAVSGFFAPKTHRVVECDDCILQPKAFSEINRAICGFIDENGVSVYDEESGNGLFRHIYMRQGRKSGEITVCAVINSEEMPFSKKFVECVKSISDKIVGVLYNVNREDTNVILGDKFVTLYGKASIGDILCGREYEISPESFYQVNSECCELLYKTAADMLGDDNAGTLIDLYCGIGTIGLSLADKFKRIVGVEIVAGAVECAKRNGKRSEKRGVLCRRRGRAYKAVIR